MDWEKVGKVCYQLLLGIIEWGFKICAVVAGWLSLAAGGTLGMKISTGFSSLTFGLRSLFEAPAKLYKMSWLVRDYAHMNKDVFLQSYGQGAMDHFMASLNEGLMFLHQVTTNLYQHTLATVSAAFIVFSSFYLLARIIRFARQKGRGSWINRREVQLGNYIFKREKPDKTEKVPAMPKAKSHKFGNSRFSLKQLISS